MQRKRVRHGLLLAGILTTGLSLGWTPTVPAQALSPPTLKEAKTNARVPLDNIRVIFQGKTYTVDGSLHGTFSSRQRKDGGWVLKGHLNAQGISVAAPDGTVYRGVGAANLQARTNANASSATFKAVANIGLIGQGKAANVRLRVNLRGTVDSQGQVTLNRDTVELRRS